MSLINVVIYNNIVKNCIPRGLLKIENMKE